MKYTYYRSVFLYSYLLTSVLLSLGMILLTSYPLSDHSITAHSSLFMLFALNVWMFVSKRPYLDTYAESDSPINFFFAQYALLVLFAAQMESWSTIYLTEVPLLMAIIFKMREDRIGHTTQLKQMMLICAIGLFGQVMAHEIFFKNEVTQLKLFLTLSSFWKVFPLLGVYAFHREKSDRKKIVVGESKNVFVERQSPRDSLFFHDMINSTHGLILFLSNRIKNYEQQHINRHEMKSLLDEVKTIQSLLKDHFSYQHKNLDNQQELIPIKEAINKSVSMIKNYLPMDKNESRFIMKGLDEARNSYIYYPSFYRILNNIVKNISDNKSESVEFIFVVTESDMEITIRNSIYHLNKSKNQLSENLSRIIREEASPPQDHENNGLGLQSIMNLCHEQGGHFRFYIEEGNWVSKVYLPLTNLDKKSAA